MRIIDYIVYSMMVVLITTALYVMLFCDESDKIPVRPTKLPKPLVGPCQTSGCIVCDPAID